MQTGYATRQPGEKTNRVMVLIQAVRGHSLVVALGVVAVAAGASAGPVGSVFNPNDYTALNNGTVLSYASGTLTFNTDNGSVSHSVDGSLGTGFVDQPNEGGAVKMTVFPFASINLASGVLIDVTGRRGIVLASQGDFTFGSGVSLSVAGTDGQDNNSVTGWANTSIGRGGPGADGSATDYDGNRNVARESNPPGTYSGDGGFCYYSGGSYIYYGRGFGGGISRYGGSYDPDRYADGGSYGGAGYNTTITYGDAKLANLYGGSGGGGAMTQNRQCTGGGGGGAVELVARGNLIFAGTINAYGGMGQEQHNSYFGSAQSGGGSGGGVLLAGDSIEFASTGVINAKGGNPTYAYDASTGGGGGGRVAFYLGNIWRKSVNDLFTCNGDNNGDGLGGDLNPTQDDNIKGLTWNAAVGAVNVKGGIGSDNNTAGDGDRGTFYVLQAPPPKGLVLAIQ